MAALKILFFIFLFLFISCHGLLESFSENQPQSSSIATNNKKICPGHCTSQLASVFMCDETLVEGEYCHGNHVCCVDKSFVNKTKEEKEEDVRITPEEVLEEEEEEIEEDVCPGVCLEKKLAQENCEKILGEQPCPRGSVCCVKNGTVGVGGVGGAVGGRRECKGTCRNVIFGLFLCDEIDEGAECGGQACCIMHVTTTTTKSVTTTTEKIEDDESEEEIVSPQPRPLHRPPPPPVTPPPACRSYCVPRAAAPYCRVPLPGQCGINAACCGHDLMPLTTTPPPMTTPPPTTTTTTDESLEGTTEATEPCPGQCIRPIMSFTCFLNAEMTDAFKCADDKMKCCAPRKNFNVTIGNGGGGGGGGGGVVVAGGQQNVQVHQSYQKGKVSQQHVAQVPQQHVAQVPLLPPLQVPQQQLQQQQQQQLPQQQQQQHVAQVPNPDRTFSHPQQQQQVQQQHRYICGVKGTPTPHRKRRVVGGADSLPGEWCWQVALINSLNQYLCGGALIGVGWVLTAAHCVTNIVRSGDSIYIRTGDHDLTSKYGSPGAQTLRVATTYIHHNHNSQTLDNDIALLKLSGQVSLTNQGVCLVCLPSRSSLLQPGRRCTVTGYGYMGESGPIPLRVREANLPIVSDSECIRNVNAVTEKPFVLPVSSFCAGGEERNDACQGDGGGPLVCKEDDYYELTGLVSWGFGCARKNVPGVYVKVSSFIGWINQIISISN